MVDTAMLLGATDRATVEQEMWDVVTLESQIAQVFIYFIHLFSTTC